MRTAVYTLLAFVAASLHVCTVVCAAQPCLDGSVGRADSAAGLIDRHFDRTDQGDSFSCDLKIRASAAADAIESFRFGVLYDSERHIRKAVRFPLRVTVQSTRDITETPRESRIRNFEEWLSFKRRYLSRFHVATIACANLHTVSIVKSRSYGFMIGPGTVWFQLLVGDPGVRVTAINLTPIDETGVTKACVSKLTEP